MHQALYRSAQLDDSDRRVKQKTEPDKATQVAEKLVDVTQTSVEDDNQTLLGAQVCKQLIKTNPKPQELFVLVVVPHISQLRKTVQTWREVFPDTSDNVRLIKPQVCIWNVPDGADADDPELSVEVSDMLNKDEQQLEGVEIEDHVNDAMRKLIHGEPEAYRKEQASQVVSIGLIVCTYEAVTMVAHRMYVSEQHSLFLTIIQDAYIIAKTPEYHIVMRDRPNRDDVQFEEGLNTTYRLFLRPTVLPAADEIKTQMQLAEKQVLEAQTQLEVSEAQTQLAKAQLVNARLKMFEMRPYLLWSDSSWS